MKRKLAYIFAVPMLFSVLAFQGTAIQWFPAREFLGARRPQSDINISTVRIPQTATRMKTSSSGPSRKSRRCDSPAAFSIQLSVL